MNDDYVCDPWRDNERLRRRLCKERLLRKLAENDAMTLWGEILRLRKRVRRLRRERVIVPASVN